MRNYPGGQFEGKVVLNDRYDANFRIDSTAATQTITVSVGMDSTGNQFLPQAGNPQSQSSGSGQMQVQAGCAPAISSVQVNGIATNTIIAGTSGYASLFGQCMTGATAVGLPPGVTVSSFNVYNNGAQINVFFTSQANAATGQHNLTVTTQQGTSTSNAPAVTVALTLQKFMFTDSVAYSRDCAGSASPIAQPTWPSPTAGVTCPQNGYAGDHAVYAAGKTMAGTAVFNVSPALTQAITGAYVQGVTDSSGTFAATNVTIPAGQTSFSASVTDATAFQTSQTQFLNPMNTNWSVAQTGSSCNNSTYGCVAVGMSANPVYVTLADSVLATFAMPAMLTYVALAVGNGGAGSQTAALAGTWAKFSTGSGPANVVTWDGRAMSYYTMGFGSCALDAGQLVQNLPTPSGQCGAFAFLLESVLAMNGIHSTWIQVQPADGASLIVIKKWGLSASPTYSTQTPWQYNFILNGCPICSIDLMVPVSPGGYGDLTNDLSGLSGQGEITPLEKVFLRHFIVKISIAAPGNQYYDPSYGFTYPGEAGFEMQAIEGYAAQLNGDDTTSGSYHFRAPPFGALNISFVENPGSSM